MLRRKVIKRVLVSSCLLSGGLNRSVLHAAVMTTTYTVPNINIGSGLSIPITPFNASLGTLNSVEVSGSGNLVDGLPPRMVGAAKGRIISAARSPIMARRKYTREFKVSAVQLVNEQGYTIPDAAKSLGVDPTAFEDGWSSLALSLA